MRRSLTRERLRELVEEVPESAYARYPALSREAVVEAVEDFLAGVGDEPSDTE